MSYSAASPASLTETFRPTLEMCFRGHRQGVHSVAFLPTLSPTPLAPRVVSGGADGAVMLWDVKATTRAMRFVGHRGPVLAVASSTRANLLASGGHDGYVRLWIPNTRRTTVACSLHAEAANERNSCGWRGHAGATRAIAFAEDGSDHLYTAGNDKTVKCWDLNYASSSHHIGAGPGNKFVGSFNAAPSSSGPHAAGHMNWVRTVAVQSAYTSSTFHHYLASGGDDEAICVWDARTRAAAHVLLDCHASVHSLHFHPNGHVLASGDASGTVNVFDLRRTSSSSSWSHTGAAAEQRHTHASSLLQHHGGAHAGGVNSVAFSPNGGWLLSAGNDGTAKMWDVREAYLYCAIHGHDGPVKSGCFSEDSRWCVTGGGADKTVLLWRSGLAASTAGGAPAMSVTPARHAADAAATPAANASLAAGTTAALRPTVSATESHRSAAPRCKLRDAPAVTRRKAVDLSSRSASVTPRSDGNAVLLGRPPLSPSPLRRDAAVTSETLERRGTATPMREFERSEERYSHLVEPPPPSGSSSSSPPQLPIVQRSAAHAAEDGSGRGAVDSIDDVVAAEEREQEALVAQERAYQRLQEDRITQQRIANLESAIASLASYIQSQQAQQTEELRETREITRSRADRYDSDLAELKLMIAQLATSATHKATANGAA
ncbi:WD domain, G-beta repeat [Novymonas esmeraldas]|uniref:WD domain, G-beta repeat n=1 Tax=Novymonas esmeraldas TaxID=1808958 RepID=A0AAW0F0B9_9TRYP